MPQGVNFQGAKNTKLDSSLQKN